MKERVKHVIRQIYLDNWAKSLIVGVPRTSRWLMRRLRRVDRRIISSYLTEHATRKLHIGCGSNLLAGWLNTEFFPVSPEVLHLDATRSFPFNDGTFDCIFSEHMIEHVPYVGGVSMVEQCYRTLKPGGVIRISTPDLRFLMDLYTNNKSDLQKRYMEWSACCHGMNLPYCDDTFIINNFVRCWGHLFIYDEKTLRLLLQRAGFVNVTRCDIGESEQESLRNLENVKRMPAGFVKLESLILEAKKADGSGAARPRDGGCS